MNSIMRLASRFGLAALLGLAAITSNATVTEYVHTDALGSIVAVTDLNRAVIERREYEPFGEQLSPAVQNGPGYTGHAQDAATGLAYMQQRYYDPSVGRFLSSDPDPVEVTYGSNANRYFYAASNPYSAIDPNGRRCISLNSDSPFCARRDIYSAFDRGVSGSTRFFAAAALTVEYLANADIPLANLGAGWLSPSAEADQFLRIVSRDLFTLNGLTFSQIYEGFLGGPRLDARLVSMEQTAVQERLDALPEQKRNRIIDSVNAAFARRGLASNFSESDARYNRVLDRVEEALGRAIDFGKQSDREAIGNALIKDLRDSGACTVTGTRIRSC